MYLYNVHSVMDLKERYQIFSVRFEAILMVSCEGGGGTGGGGGGKEGGGGREGRERDGPADAMIST